MTIVNSTLGDIDVIFQLYEEGTAYQKSMAEKHWKGFERSLIETEINENRQWKILIDGQIACIFALTDSDPFIWQEKDKEPSIYIHRISANPLFRGNGFTKRIVHLVRNLSLIKNPRL